MRGRPVLAFLKSALVGALFDQRAEISATFFFVYRWRRLDQSLAELSGAP
jgi:hypothetical protein